jgi:soluble P-type ATPase
MIEIDIPGFGPVRLEHLVSDFTGTLSVDGRLLPGLKEMLNQVAGLLAIHILTADTFGSATAELQGVRCAVHLLEGKAMDGQKEDFVKTLGSDEVVAFGNGKNDRLMLKTARIGIAVCFAEGCARDAVSGSDLLVNSPIDAIGLLLNPKRLKATLRY